MTSFIIQQQATRPPSTSWMRSDDYCPFCEIIHNGAPAFRIYEDDYVLAILDILPLRRGHILVIPKVHCSRISDLEPPYSAALGVAVSNVSKALVAALDNTGLNIVANQEYAQAVMHVHYHIIPAPTFNNSVPVSPQPSATALTPAQMHRAEYEARQELDDDDGKVLMAKIRARL